MTKPEYERSQDDRTDDVPEHDGQAPREGDLPSLSESFALVDELGNSLSTETDENLTHGQ